MDKVIFNTEYFKVSETEKGFFYGERRGRDSISILPYFIDEGGEAQVVVRLQPMPLDNSSNNVVYPSTVTGSFTYEENSIDRKLSLVYEELQEELGVEKHNVVGIKELLPTVATTQMNETVFNFLVEINENSYKANGEGDGTIFEEMSENVVVDLEILYSYIEESKDMTELFKDLSSKNIKGIPLAGLPLALGYLHNRISPIPEKCLILTKDTLIEGKIETKGTKVVIK